MNDEMRKMHMAQITDVRAIAMYDTLCAACERREGGMNEADQMLIADCARAEQIKQTLLDDIASRGIGQERWNGRQRYYAANKSVDQVRSFAEQQRKLLGELKLTPGSRRAEDVAVGDDFDAF